MQRNLDINNIVESDLEDVNDRSEEIAKKDIMFALIYNDQKYNEKIFRYIAQKIKKVCNYKERTVTINHDFLITGMEDQNDIITSTPQETCALIFDAIDYFIADMMHNDFVKKNPDFSRGLLNLH